MAAQQKTSRRQFLFGESAIRAMEDALPQADRNTDHTRPTEPVKPTRYLIQIGRQAMACDFEILLNAGEHPGATEAAVAALDLVDRLESQLTVYRSSSEIVTINERAALEAVPVEARLFQLLQRAVEVDRLTQGAFDITSGPLSKAWGFFRRMGRMPSREEIEEAKSRTGSRWLELDESTRSIRFHRPDLEINLNAIGKGYALDRCAELLGSEGVSNFIIHGGLSSILARGAQATESSEPGWLVGLRHPYKPAMKLADIVLENEALGTSGAANQFFHFNGKRYGHIIDPRTGWPADQVLSATVIAGDAATADALATAFYVMGVEESLALCEGLPDVSVVFVCSGGRAGEVELITHGVRSDQLRISHSLTSS